MPDPDNPSQSRQIDITVRGEGKLTFIECRGHRAAQDVTWIEELIGRRASLRPDTIIGVSSSGFTMGALRKAKEHGIIVRELGDLSDAEVSAWSGQSALTLYFYQYSDLQLSVCFDSKSISRLDEGRMKSDFVSSSVMQSFFNAAAQQLGSVLLPDEDHVGQTVSFGVRLELDGFQLSGEEVVGAEFTGKACLISQEVALKAVLGYRNPADETPPKATVETFDLGDTSIVHDGDRIAVRLNISQAEIPLLCQFRFFKLMGNEERDHELFELIGVDRLYVRVGKITVRVFYRTADIPTPGDTAG
jgi:hypothetical protein